MDSSTIIHNAFASTSLHSLSDILEVTTYQDLIKRLDFHLETVSQSQSIHSDDSSERSFTYAEIETLASDVSHIESVDVQSVNPEDTEANTDELCQHSDLPTHIPDSDDADKANEADETDRADKPDKPNEYGDFDELSIPDYSLVDENGMDELMRFGSSEDSVKSDDEPDYTDHEFEGHEDSLGNYKNQRHLITVLPDDDDDALHDGTKDYESFSSDTHAGSNIVVYLGSRFPSTAYEFGDVDTVDITESEVHSDLSTSSAGMNMVSYVTSPLANNTYKFGNIESLDITECEVGLIYNVQEAYTDSNKEKDKYKYKDTCAKEVDYGKSQDVSATAVNDIGDESPEIQDHELKGMMEKGIEFLSNISHCSTQQTTSEQPSRLPKKSKLVKGMTKMFKKCLRSMSVRC